MDRCNDYPETESYSLVASSLPLSHVLFVSRGRRPLLTRVNDGREKLFSDGLTREDFDGVRGRSGSMNDGLHDHGNTARERDGWMDWKLGNGWIMTPTSLFSVVSRASGE